MASSERGMASVAEENMICEEGGGGGRRQVGGFPSGGGDAIVPVVQWVGGWVFVPWLCLCVVTPFYLFPTIPVIITSPLILPAGDCTAHWEDHLLKLF